jgi:hypothetical protein
VALLQYLKSIKKSALTLLTRGVRKRAQREKTKERQEAEEKQYRAN